MVLFLAACAVTTARLRLLHLPLERDEGEYAYGAWLLSGAGTLYRDLYSMKWPGIYAVYAAIMEGCGWSVAGIRTGALIVNGLAAVGLALLCRERMSRSASLLATSAFLVLTISPAAHGVMANAEHFILPWLTWGLWALLRSLRRTSMPGLLLAGLLLGVGPTIKQHAGIFVILACLLIWQWGISNSSSRHGWAGVIVTFGAGVLIPVVIVLVAVSVTGVFPEFVRWTLAYPRSYASQISATDAPLAFAIRAWPIAMVWCSILFLSAVGIFRDLQNRRTAHCWAIWLLLTSLIAISPGFYYRPHYFLLLAPALAVLSGLGCDSLLERGQHSSSPRRAGLAVVCGILILAPLCFEGGLLWKKPINAVSREIYGNNPLVESEVVAEALQAHSQPDDRIAIFGSEPQIAFLAQRHLAGGFIYMYPLMEQHQLAGTMQKQMIAEVTAAEPEFVVVVNTRRSWLRRDASIKTLHDWMPSYLKAFQPWGWMRIGEESPELTRVSESTDSFPPWETQQTLLVYRRTPEAPHASRVEAGLR